MIKISLFIVIIALAVGHSGVEADSLASKFGRKRVKIQRAETPVNVSDAKMKAVQSRYDERVDNCRGQADRNKQYCLQEAEQELRMSERRLRDAARAEAASK